MQALLAPLQELAEFDLAREGIRKKALTKFWFLWYNETIIKRKRKGFYEAEIRLHQSLRLSAKRSR